MLKRRIVIKKYLNQLYVLLVALSSQMSVFGQPQTTNVPFPKAVPVKEISGHVKDHPNIVLIVADDFGYGDLSCYGATKIVTPHVDKLASEGIKFTDAYVVSSICSPSRYSILTGHYSWRTHLQKGVLTPFAPPLIEENRTTLASMLKKAGYYTACIGKWHLGFNWALKDNAPPDAEESVFNAWGTGTQEYIDFSKPVKGGPVERGFDYFYGMSGSNNMMPFVLIENEEIIAPPSVPNNFGAKTLKAPDWDLRFLDQKFIHKAVEVIDNHFQNKKTEPLFLYFPTSAVHQPCLPSVTKGQSQAGMRGDMVLEFDRMVGELVKALEKHASLENTLIIITSDNGPLPGDPFSLVERFKNNAFGDEFDYDQPYSEEYKPEYPGNNGQEKGWLVYGHNPTAGFLGFKSDAWEGGLRVPFIVHWPGKIKKGGVNTNVISTVDLLATLADITGEKMQDNEGEDSYSFLSNLLDENAPQVRKSLTMIAGRSGAMAVRKDDWKYIEAAIPQNRPQSQSYPPPPNEYPGIPSVFEPQVYNLKDDPYEKNNLLDQVPDQVTELKGLIEKVKTNIKSEEKFIVLPKEEVTDKIRGGLLGQILGNLNGLPHEMKYINEPGNVKNYVPSLPDGAWSDDDTDFEWVYVVEMQRNRTGFLSHNQIFDFWKERINNRVWCSNLYARYLMDIGIKPPYTGNGVFNPWAGFNISGQFLCETFGLMAPAMPQTAARIGLNYTTVAIDNEPAQATQLFTSMISTAFVEKDINKILDAGIKALDEKSLLLEIIKDIRSWHEAFPDNWRETRRLLKEKYTREGGNIRDSNGHELNTGSIIAALLYGNGDFAESLKFAFNFGWDADCNAATVGTIVGVTCGYRKMLNQDDPYRQDWQIVDRYKNVTRDNMPMDETITSFADRVIELFEMINEQNGGAQILHNDTIAYKIVFEEPGVVKKLTSGTAQNKLSQQELEPQILNDLLTGEKEDMARAAYLAICLDLDAAFVKKYPGQWKKACYALSGYWKVMNNVFPKRHNFIDLNKLQQKFEESGFKVPVKNYTNQELWNDKTIWKDPEETY